MGDRGIIILEYPHGNRDCKLHSVVSMPSVTTSAYAFNNLIVEMYDSMRHKRMREIQTDCKCDISPLLSQGEMRSDDTPGRFDEDLARCTDQAGGIGVTSRFSVWDSIYPHNRQRQPYLARMVRDGYNDAYRKDNKVIGTLTTNCSHIWRTGWQIFEAYEYVGGEDASQDT